MDLEAHILFKDVVADTDPEDVMFRLQCCANEWFFPEVTKTMPDVQVSTAPPPCEDEIGLTPDFVTSRDGLMPDSWELNPAPLLKKPAPQPEKPARNKDSQLIFVISDLHLGDKGSRDNFFHMSNGNRLHEFQAFLDFVEEQNGRLIIVGDLFELWQSNISEVLTIRASLLDRLAKMKAIYVLGNHDADLCYFCSYRWLTHSFFKTMVTHHVECIGGKSFCFIHGHEVDSSCASNIPGLGRITAIYTGLKEDRNRSPLLDKYRTIEAKSIGRMERLANFIRRCCGKPDRTKVMNLGLCAYLDSYNVVISGHTHRAGQLWSEKIRLRRGLLPIYNTGTWAENVCSFVTINPTGRVGVCDWVDGRAQSNTTRIEV